MSLSKENKVIIDGQTYYGGLNQPPKFVKVNVDCWEKIFDYLSLRDILSMSQTCQRMRQIGGYYFRENFHGTVCWLNADSSPWVDAWNGSVELERDDFLRFVDTVNIHNDLKHLKYYSSSNLLGSVTTLHLWEVKLNANAIGNFEKSLLDSIKTVKLDCCKINDDSDGQLFASCPKLKCLKICGSLYTSRTAENNLLRYTFPTLEHFAYFGRHEANFTSFLERNSSIRSLWIDADYLLGIGLNTLTVQLDRLSIEVNDMNVEAVELANRLKTLHANGFYKKLHLGLGGFIDHEMFINEMASFSALEVLKTYNFSANIRHSIELKELHLFELDSAADLESIAKKLTKLERLWIWGTVDHLMPFLRNSKALKWAVLSHRDADPLNLFQLNQVRQMGGSQRKVSIGIYAENYLATKWKSKNLKYDLVEVVRAETIKEYFHL